MLSKKFRQIVILVFITLFLANPALATDPCANGQRPDPDFHPSVSEPAFPDAGGKRPVVVIDGEHHNFHTMEGRYKPFAELLQKDGYDVNGSSGIYEVFSKEALAEVDILVIANALNQVNVGVNSCIENWKYPIPSAFDGDEIEAVVDWVTEGGSLMLMADHFPFGEAAGALAEAFGVVLSGGYTANIDTGETSLKFVRLGNTKTGEGLLEAHPVTEGRKGRSESVDSLISFGGEVFWMHPQTEYQALMVVGAGSRNYFLSDAKDFYAKTREETPGVSSYALLQGAALRVGKGKVAIFGEAGMFSAQREDTGEVVRTGMNHPDAIQNQQFTLNVMRWLAGVLPDE